MILQTILIVLHMGPHHRELKYFINQGERDLTGRFFKFLSPPGLRQDSGSHLGRMSLLTHSSYCMCEVWDLFPKFGTFGTESSSEARAMKWD